MNLTPPLHVPHTLPVSSSLIWSCKYLASNFLQSPARQTISFQNRLAGVKKPLVQQSLASPWTARSCSKYRAWRSLSRDTSTSKCLLNHREVAPNDTCYTGPLYRTRSHWELCVGDWYCYQWRANTTTTTSLRTEGMAWFLTSVNEDIWRKDVRLANDSYRG